VHLCCGFSLWRQMAPQQSAKFRTAFSCQFCTSLRKDSVASYASIWTLFSLFVTGQDVLWNRGNLPVKKKTPHFRTYSILRSSPNFTDDGDSLPKSGNFDIFGAAFPPPYGDCRIEVKFCTPKRTKVPVGRAKFDMNRCNESPLLGEKPDFWPGSLPIRLTDAMHDCYTQSVLPQRVRNCIHLNFSDFAWVFY